MDLANDMEYYNTINRKRKDFCKMVNICFGQKEFTNLVENYQKYKI